MCANVATKEPSRVWTGNVSDALQMFLQKRVSGVDASSEVEFSQTQFGRLLTEALATGTALTVSLLLEESTPERFRFRVNWTTEDETKITVVCSDDMVPGTFLFDERLPRDERKLLIATFGSRLARRVTLSSDGYKVAPVDQKVVARISDGFDLDPANDEDEDE